MINAILLFARYNSHVDRLLYGLLDDVDPELLSRPVGAYFGPVTGILNHILTSDLGWLARFRDGGVTAEALKSPALVFDHPGFGKILHSEYGELKVHQQQVDQVIIELAEELTVPATGTQTPGSEQVFAYANTKGENHRSRVGDILLHLLNHATHHRGQISQILDQAGVAHDYSNVWPLLEEQ
jgi:uncharacterized damage-inducible protein DinB